MASTMDIVDRKEFVINKFGYRHQYPCSSRVIESYEDRMIDEANKLIHQLRDSKTKEAEKMIFQLQKRIASLLLGKTKDDEEFETLFN